MKLFKKRNFIFSRELYTILIISILIFILSFYRPLYFIKGQLNSAIANGYQLSNFDILCSFEENGLLDAFSFAFVIIPIFSALMIYVIDTNNSLIRVIRYKDRNKIWNRNILLVLVSAFLLSTLLVFGGYLASGLFVKGYNNTWNTELGLPYIIYGMTKIWPKLSSLLVTYKVIPIFWITIFLGLSFIGIFICTAKLFIRNVYVYAGIIAIVFGDIYGIFGIKLMLGVSMSSRNWLYPNSIIIGNMYFIIGIFVLYFMGKYINSKKDQGIAKKH